MMTTMAGLQKFQGGHGSITARKKIEIAEKKIDIEDKVFLVNRAGNC